MDLCMIPLNGAQVYAQLFTLVALASVRGKVPTSQTSCQGEASTLMSVAGVLRKHSVRLGQVRRYYQSKGLR